MNLKKFIKQYAANTEMSKSDTLLFDSMFQPLIADYLSSHPDDQAAMHYYLNQALVSTIELSTIYLANVLSAKYLNFLEVHTEYKIGLHHQLELFFERAPELKEKVFKKENKNENEI